jgi:hypothetical protein
MHTERRALSSFRAASRVLAASFLVASCLVSPNPPEPLSSDPSASALPPSTTSPNVVPTRGPTPVPGAQAIGARWEHVAIDKDWRPADIAGGPAGWVAGGSMRCREQGCGRSVAATWFSTDGFTWTGGPVPDGRQATIRTVATDGDRWFAAGSVAERVGDTFHWKALIWRSLNGRDWTLVGSIPHAPPEKGIWPIGELVAGPGGLILTWVDPGGPEKRTVYWSDNGESWLPVDKTSSDVPPPAWGETVVNGRFVIVANCGGCGTVWSSRNGRDWRLDATLSGDTAGLDVASDGRQVVVVIVDEQCADACHARILSSDDGRTGWTSAPQVLPAGDPLVTYAADTYIVTTNIWELDPRFGAQVFTSRDGLRWTEFVETAFRPRDCDARELEGTEDRVVMLGEGGCEGLWVSLAP